MVVEKSRRQLLSLRSRKALQVLRDELKLIEKRAEKANSDTDVSVASLKLARLSEEVDKLSEEIAEFKTAWDPQAG